jgi:hypothetical protein
MGPSWGEELVTRKHRHSNRIIYSAVYIWQYGQIEEVFSCFFLHRKCLFRHGLHRPWLKTSFTFTPCCEQIFLYGNSF